MICSRLMWEEWQKPEPDDEKIERWQEIQARAWRERERLDLKDHDAVEAAIQVYGGVALELQEPA